MRTGVAEPTVQIWERLQVVTGEPGAEGYYSCRVTDIRSDHLLISRPAFEYGRSLLSDNRIVDVNFTRADAAYTFSARLKELEPKAADQMHLLDLGAVRRLQRRRFVRLDLSVSLRYYLLLRPLTERPTDSMDRFRTVRSINLSAGGMLIPMPEKPALGDRILLNLTGCPLKNVPPYLVAICRQTRLDEAKQQVAGFEFILEDDLYRHFSSAEKVLLPDEVMTFDSHMQNALVAELFAEQIQLRQKGLL